MTLADVVIISLILGASIWYFFRKKFTYWSERNVQVVEPSVPFGNLFEVVTGKLTIGHTIAKLYSKIEAPYFGFYSLWTPNLALKDLDIMKTILIKDFDKFRNRSFASDEKADPMAYHLLFGMRGDAWKNMRAKLSPAFTSGKLKLMLPLIKECAEDLDTYLKQTSGQVQNMKEVCAKFTTDTITSCAFGIKANSFVSENSEFRTAGRRIFDFTPSRSIQATCYFFAPFLVSLFKLKFIDPRAANFLRSVFWETTEKRESGQAQPRNDLIDILISLKNEDKSLLDGDALPAQAVTFFSAGHETTASSISFTLFELCMNPHMQTRLREEVLQTINQHGDLTYEGLQEMTYLNMIVSETLRKYPFAPFVGRTALEDYKVPGHNLTIEKGVNVVIPLHGLHFDPKYYPEPHVFDPERFNKDNKHKIPQFAYLPFGEGPRSCIGERFGLLTTKIAVALIVKDFNILKDDTTPNKLSFNPRAPLLMAIGGIPVKLVARKA